MSLSWEPHVVAVVVSVVVIPWECHRIVHLGAHKRLWACRREISDIPRCHSRPRNCCIVGRVVAGITVAAVADASVVIVAL